MLVIRGSVCLLTGIELLSVPLSEKAQSDWVFSLAEHEKSNKQQIQERDREANVDYQLSKFLIHCKAVSADRNGFTF